MYDAMVALDCVTVVILAGGLGTRLRSVIGDSPKVLAPVHNRPFLAYLLEQIAQANIKQAVLCLGYRGNQVRSVFGDAYTGMRLVYSQESSPLGTAGALRLAMPLFQSDPVLVMNGDSFCEVDFEAFWTWHLTRRADATLLLTQVPNMHRYGRVQVDEEGRVLAFEEKDGRSTLGWVNAGVYLINHRLVQAIPMSDAVSLEREVFPAWVGRGLYGYPSQGRFLDIGTPEAYAMAEQFFAPKTLA